MTMNTKDLTHAEAVDAFRQIKADIGSNAYVSVSLNVDPWAGGGILLASIYPEGVSKNAVRVTANTFAELLALAKAKVVERTDTLGAKTIREMALRIISITADEGSCSEFSLCKAFSAGEVKAYGDRACEEATRIAGNGPFLIVRAASEVEAA